MVAGWLDLLAALELIFPHDRTGAARRPSPSSVLVSRHDCAPSERARNAADDDVLAAAAQPDTVRRHPVRIIAAAVVLVVLFAYAVKEGLARHGIKFSFSFLWDAAGFDISEGRPSSSTALLAGLHGFHVGPPDRAGLRRRHIHTIKVAVLAIVLSTVLGTMLGVGRLSTNWVVRNLSFWCVEFVRNTPLLIQLVFWYFAVVLHFPPIAAAPSSMAS
ncbi:ABC transporter permease subunit (plasmid) [Rhizobium oryzihabitans]|uniref:ABC transporter permease subunit n=1 Tax=Rhizobium oryzihabitans TaxID=2267833 RepID=A0A7L5BR51_9HYPH|nr:ABC transporter permease subunit [Rhizobium oryzihabitans]QIB41241.1 ABC transporter permease subunit [Rhizobium oryzihabitans]